MNSFEYYKKCLKHYTDFSSRARRKEYWFFVLYNWLISVAASIVDAFIFGVSDDGVGLFGSLYALAIFIPSLAVGVRRMHDTGRSGWVLLLSLIPIIGWIVLIVFSCQDSQPENNKWGENPKQMEV